MLTCLSFKTSFNSTDTNCLRPLRVGYRQKDLSSKYIPCFRILLTDTQSIDLSVTVIE